MAAITGLEILGDRNKVKFGSCNTCMYNREENLFRGGARCSIYHSIKELGKFVSPTQKCLA